MSRDRAALAPPEPGGVLYHRPEIYDVAFGWDLSQEIEFFESLFARHMDGPVSRLLEPCCGTGRLLEAFATRGLEVVGYDRSDEMVAYAAARVAPYGGRALRGEMSAFDPPGPFDAALNLVNSIGYLLDDDAVTAHLARTGAAMRPGGIYVVQLSYGGEPPELARFGPWGNRGRDLSTTLLWEVVREDAAAKRSHQRCRITARRGKERWVIEEEHTLRYWTHEDVDRLIASSPFRLEAIYWDRFEEFPREDYRIGEFGNLYHVLKRRP